MSQGFSPFVLTIPDALHRLAFLDDTAWGCCTKSNQLIYSHRAEPRSRPPHSRQSRNRRSVP
ncbi:protein of unknown function [Paraburkholderia kururiensis]